MRVCYLTSGYTVHDRRFLQAIKDLNHECWFAAWQPVKPEKFTEISYIANVLTEEPLQTMESSCLNTLLTMNEIELMHAGPIPDVAGSVAGKINIPLVSMSWGSDILVQIEDDPLLMLRAMKAIEYSDAIICDCHYVEDKIKKLAGQRKPTVFNFPWGISQQRYLQRNKKHGIKKRNELGWKDNPVFLSVRNWEPHYQIENLIHAFYRMLKKVPLSRLILVGNGSQSDHIYHLIYNLKLDKFIYCPGKVAEEEMLTYYDAADVFINTSRSDGSSISLLEAMICGLPSIVNNAYGNLEWIEHGITGWTVDCSDAAFLSNAMVDACNQSVKWEAMGRAAIKKVKEKANWDQNFYKISMAYETAFRNYQSVQREISYGVY